ncbi:MAG: 4-(cytidine 5'-diphospho)-2-C-methyl-D-erythritol kinase [Akkermansia sp.]
MSTQFAPAKINLSLRIVAKRDDGFHEIDTLMAPLDLGDELDFHNSRTTTLSCETPGVPTDESNLVFKAVRVFEAAYGRKAKQRITLTKCVPHGAGLGGGSSDAACTLAYLNEHLGTQYDAEELASMAAELGSDVAFFLNPCISRCTGRGEVCSPVPDLAAWSSPLFLMKPDFAVATPSAYKNLAGSQQLPEFSYAPQVVDGLELFNDLERPVFAKFPILGMMKQWLLAQDGVRAAMMSGSGSSLFALTETLEQAQALVPAAKAQFGQSLFCHSGWVNPQG